MPCASKKSSSNERERDVKALLRALWAGDAALARHLLSLNVGFDARGHGGQSVLAVAAGRQDRACLAVLLDAGADIEARCQASGRRALMAAAWSGSLPCVEELLSRGADPSSVDDDGWNALMWAAKAGSLPCVQALADQTPLLSTTLQGELACELAQPGSACAAWLRAATRAAAERAALDGAGAAPSSPLHLQGRL